MNGTDYIMACARTASTTFNGPGNKNAKNILHAAMGLCTESGELMDVLKKSTYYSKPMQPTDLLEEAGDICWYLSMLLQATGYTWENLWEMNIAKLRTRYPEKFTSEKALNRDLTAESNVLNKHAGHQS